MSLLDKITVLLHTSNRPDFLARALAYFSRSDELSALRLMILDGSDDERWPQVETLLRDMFPANDYTVIHRPRSVPLEERLTLAAHACTTPYLLLAADDDFYMPGWLERGVAELEGDPTLAAVYGHTLFFELDDYVAFGRLIDYFVHPRLDPKVTWLEQNRPEDRLAAIANGTGEPSIPSWYALQRVEALRTACRLVTEAGALSNYVEYLLLFCQVALGKVRMLDQIVLARQENPKANHRVAPPFRARQYIARLSPLCCEFLQRDAGLSPSDAHALTQRFFAGILASSERSHAPIARLRRRIGAISAVAAVRARMRGADPRKTTHDYPDPRLPTLPILRTDDPALVVVRREVAPT